MSTSATPTPEGSPYKKVFILVAILLAGDLLLLALHGVRVLNPALLSPFFSIETEGGLSELFQHLKELAIILLLCIAMKRLRIKALFAWVALFSYVLIDDASAVHEYFGLRLSEVADLTFGRLGSRDVGELVVSMVAGGFLLVGIALGYWLGGSCFRSITRDLLLMFAGLVFFGIFVDMVHSLVESETPLYHVLGLVEDGGEMLVMSLILAYVWALGSVPAERRLHLVDAGWRYVRQRFF